MEQSIKNRNETFKSIVDKLPAKQLAVYKIIALVQTPVTLDELCNLMAHVNYAGNIVKKPKNELSGRVTELKQSFFIKEVETDAKGKTGKSVTAYERVGKSQQLILIRNEIFDLTFKLERLELDQKLSLSPFSRMLLKKAELRFKRKIKELKNLLDE